MAVAESRNMSFRRKNSTAIEAIYSGVVLLVIFYCSVPSLTLKCSPRDGQAPSFSCSCETL
jgi:hypothetical protein